MKRIRRGTLLKLTPEKYKSFIPEDQKFFTALDVLAIEGLPHSVNIGVALSMPRFIDPRILNEFAFRCAERALGVIDAPDPRSLAAIKAKRAWVQGAITDEELQAAREAAGDTVRDVIRTDRRNPSRTHTMGSAFAAAYNTTCHNPRDAARGAAYHAACAIDWDTEPFWQVEELKKMLREAEV